MFTPDGRWLITDGGNAIVVADATNPTQAVRVARCRAAPGMASEASDSAVHALALHPGGRFLVSVHELIDTGDGVAVGCSVVVGWDLSVPHHPTRVLIMVNPSDIPGWVHSRRSRPAPLMLRSHDGEVRAVAFRPNGTLLATASLDQTALLWDTEHAPHLMPVAQLDHPHPVTALAFSPDGQTLATANGTTTTLWNTTTVKT